MTREIWKPISEEVLNSYSVSNLGRIRNKAGKILKPQLNKKCGYLYMVFCIKGKSVTRRINRIVAFAFCDGYKEGYVANHIDHNRLNNHSDNLEWCSQKENTNTELFRKHISKALFESNKLRRKKVLMFSLNGELIKDYPSAREAARQNNVAVQNISACCLGKTATCGGYKWEYAI